MTMPRLGESLINAGKLAPESLQRALTRQANTGERLGEILLYEGLINPRTLQQELAEQQQVAFVNLANNPPRLQVVDPAKLEAYLHYRLLPWKFENGITHIACSEVNAELHAWASQTYGDEKYRFALTTERDLVSSMVALFGDTIDAKTRELLWKRNPELSAKQTFTKHQVFSSILFFILASVGFVLAPALSILITLAVLNVFYLATLAFKNLLFFGSLRWHWQMRGRPSVPPELPVKEWPIYTLLVPLYKEQEAVPRLLNAIRTLDYPKSRLDVKLIVEEDDQATINAIKAAQPEAYFEMVHVPKSQPRTKPKACNHALLFARGEFICIFDAEDRPEPSQLKKAVMAFRSAPAEVVCLQARLNYYNRDENLLARLFAIEYASLFDYMLPALQKLRIPIPLGGTSNHIRATALREVGNWDPYNVTEDADLGMRLAMHGYRTEMLDSITLEESPLSLKGWLPQRSRWVKGFMQTWLVYMRNPLHFLRSLPSPAGFWGFQFFVGAPALIFLLSPIVWSLCLLWLLGAFPAPTLPLWLLSMSMFVLLFGITTHGLHALLILRTQGWSGMVIAALIYPFYWLLHSVASYKALWQLITRPHYWEKTTHALTSLSQEDIAASHSKWTR